MTNPAVDPRDFYAEVGGAPVFERIVARFYEQVRDDEILRPIYPEEDLGPAEVRLRMFLEQYWGGPRTYSEQRGHPRLRMRHAPFRIGPIERDAWLRNLRESATRDRFGRAGSRQRLRVRLRALSTSAVCAALLATGAPGASAKPPAPRAGGAPGWAASCRTLSAGRGS